MVEKWSSLEALGAHGATDHIKALGASGTLSGAPTVNVLQPANFGDDELGTI
jgi:quinol monooxygenase YgiN